MGPLQIANGARMVLIKAWDDLRDEGTKVIRHLDSRVIISVLKVQAPHCPLHVQFAQSKEECVVLLRIQTTSPIEDEDRGLVFSRLRATPDKAGNFQLLSLSGLDANLCVQTDENRNVMGA